MKEIIEINREDLIDHLVTSWRDHFEQMDDDYLINEYKEYISQDPSEDIEVILKGEK
jgi:hypothetical protein